MAFLYEEIVSIEVVIGGVSVRLSRECGLTIMLLHTVFEDDHDL